MASSSIVVQLSALGVVGKPQRTNVGKGALRAGNRSEVKLHSEVSSPDGQVVPQ